MVRGWRSPIKKILRAVLMVWMCSGLDPQDEGAAYRNVIGIPGGKANAELWPLIEAANTHGAFQKSLGVHRILVRKIWFSNPLPPEKGPQMRQNCTNQ